MAPNKSAIDKAEIDRSVVEQAVFRYERKLESNQVKSLSASALQHLLEKAKESLRSLSEIHGRIVHAAPEDLGPHNDAYEWLQDKLDAVIEGVMELQADHQPSVLLPQPQSNSTQVKLPQLNLPEFHGNYEDWPSFEDLFKASVAKNKNLSDAQKLQYLKSCTKGEANTLIKSFPTTDSNYREAWALLQSRYNNTREIISSLIKKLIHQNSIKQGNSTDLQVLLNRTQECIRSLKVMGREVDKWDDLLVVIISEKLDSECKSEWAKTLTDTSPPTFKQLTDFLEGHIRALTARGLITAPKGRSDQPRATRAHHSTPGQSSGSNGICPLCKSNHTLHKCSQFHGTPINDRFAVAQQCGVCTNCLYPSHQHRDCPSKHTCRKCNKKHHTFLHKDSVAPGVTQQKETPTQESSAPAVRSHHAEAEVTKESHVLLKTAQVQVTDDYGNHHIVRALLDCGSESSFITESLVTVLGLPRTSVNVNVEGVGQSGAGNVKWSVPVRVSSRIHTAFIDIEALVLKKVTGKLPRYTCNSKWDHLANLDLADPTFESPGQIDILLGADAVASAERPGLVKGPKLSPTASNTIFGWVLYGRVPSQQQSIVRSFHTTSLEEIVQRLWLDPVVSVPGSKLFTAEESKCENHFLNNFVRDVHGRFQVRLPFHSNAKPIGETRGLAESRLLALERRFRKHPQHQQEYVKFMDEYISTGHMSLVTPAGSRTLPLWGNPTSESEAPPKPDIVYIPHHFVTKEDSTTTKLRVVFDASMKSTNGVSLNDMLMNGPTIQDDLFSHLMRFRMNPIALKADIAKMYRQFLVHPHDRDKQRILWRRDPSDPIQEYTLNTVTYGFKPAGFLATRCLQQLAEEEASNFPEASTALQRNMYVDDLLSGKPTANEALNLFTEVTTITSKAGMCIRKWVSNSKEVMDAIPENLREDISALSFDKDDCVKALGIVWNPKSDTFSFSTKANPTVKTKRNLLSEISKVFDPLGWLSPLTISAKILFQESWKRKQSWDDPLNEQQIQEWDKYQQQLTKLESFRITRCVLPTASVPLKLAGFSDASERAIGACIYLICECKDGTHQSNLLASRTRVAPINQISLPRQELNAAKLLCDLIEDVKSALNISLPVQCYTDSMIVLKWISSTSRRWKTYVANRVAAIQEIVPSEQWSHVPGTENPADLPSRGISVDELISSTLWFHGPSWLTTGTSPASQRVATAQIDSSILEDREAETFSHHTQSNELCQPIQGELPPLLNWAKDFSSIRKLTFHTYVFQSFASHLLNKQCPTEPRLRILTYGHRPALLALIKISQQHYFKEDIAQLKRTGQVKFNSKILPLAPKYEDDILRVGGRIQRAQLPFARRHPILLCSKCPITKLIVENIHLSLLHSSLQLTLATIQQKYWIVGARDFVRDIIRKCVPCRIARATTMQQQMGILPAPRVNPSRPFTHTGVDFAGPFLVRPHKGRGIPNQKYYFCIFVCMATKATHLEPVSDLSTDAFIASLRRFVSRRGHVTDLYSDCGKNFKGAERELRQFHEQMKNDYSHIPHELITTFHFNTPGASNQGGLWEAGVKNVKHHIKRVVGNRSQTIEQFNTLLCQIEACLNSRPITSLSSSPDDFEALTPGHFLIGAPLNAIPEGDVSEIPINRLDHWQQVQQMTQHFWARWRNEFVMSLQQRAKWKRKEKNIAVDDLVLITSENLPPTQWKLGRVVEVHFGIDNLARSATIRCVANTKTNPIQYSIFKRPINKLALILSADEAVS